MADSVATQTIFDSSKKLIMKFTNISDGTGESAVKKVDVSALTPAATLVKINKITFATNGMSVQLLWDATANIPAFILPDSGFGVLCFKAFGGLINNAGTGVTGDILFTTFGHTAGDSYSIILEMDKS